MIQNVYWSSCKELHIVVFTELNLNSIHGFSKNNLISNFMVIRQVGADFFPGAD